MKLSIYIILILIAIPSAFSLTLPGEPQIICSYLSLEINTGQMKIPEFVPLNNEAVNLYLGDSDLIGNIMLKDKVVSVECNENPQPTYNVRIKNINVLKNLKESESPIDFINEKISSGEIIIEPQSFGKKVTWFLAKTGLKIIGLFVR